MSDLISRSALKEHIGSYAGMFTDELGFAVSMEAVLRGIDFAESVDAVEVVRGEWIWNGKHWECSNCRRDRLHDLVLGLDAAYCPYCGAKMDGERRTDD